MDAEVLDFQRWVFERIYNKSRSLTVKELLSPFLFWMPMLAPIFVWVAFHAVHIKGF